jgi:nitrite reductase/ring-hydroxylating ferredoxin subunit
MKCQQQGCKVKNAVFAFAKTDKIRFCKKHKLDGMEDIKNKRCLQVGCNTQRRFNYPNEVGGLYCAVHKLDGMINVVDKRCLHDGCDTRPTFNHPSEIGGLYCTVHKLNGMINVVDKRCLHDGCDTQPNFNYESERIPIYCKKHKLANMVDIKNKKCYIDGCDTQPKYNYKNEDSAIYCASHKLDKMVNVVTKQCVLCEMVTAIKHYDYHCYGCYSYLHPNDPRVRNFKTKEHAIMSVLKEKYPDMILDKVISGGCSRKRPDGILDLGSHVIIVEVDENQHQSYDTICDNKRTMALSQDLAHRPIVFIRINPDRYKLDDKTVSGAFSITKATGLLKTHPKILKKRIDAASDLISRYHKIVPDRTITVEQLYFDGYEE